MGLSMDDEVIENLAYVSKYFDIVPDNAYYKLMCDIIPQGRRYVKWIKANKPKYNAQLIETIAAHYKISKREAYAYCDHYTLTEEGISELIYICSMHGHSDLEIENMLESKEEKK
jgi:hypothetical protein